jgi:hypothetical protein
MDASMVFLIITLLIAVGIPFAIWYFDMLPII